MTDTATMDAVLALVERSLEFRWDVGGVTPVEDGHTTGWRVLPTFLTAHLTGGRGEMLVEGEPRRTYRDGDTVVMPAGVRHRLTLLGPRAVSSWSHVDLRIFGGALDALALLTPPWLLHDAVSTRIGALNAELTALARASVFGVAQVARRKALGFELFALVAEASTPAPGALERLRLLQRLAPALALIEQDVERGEGRVAVPDLARVAGVSPSRLHALFHAALGVPPLRHLLGQRLRRAQHLLISSDLPVQEVAARAGFGDAFHFSRTFRRAFGDSPTSYRASLVRG